MVTRFFCKRLEKGTFEMLRPKRSFRSEEDLPTVQVTYQELAMLLDGVDLSTVRRRKRYARRRK